MSKPANEYVQDFGRTFLMLKHFLRMTSPSKNSGNKKARLFLDGLFT